MNEQNIINVHECPARPEEITLAYMMAVEVAADKDGAVVEWIILNDPEDDWEVDPNPDWEWVDGFGYRIQKPKHRYGYDTKGNKIEIPAGWEIIPEGEAVNKGDKYYSNQFDWCLYRHFNSIPCDGKAKLTYREDGRLWVSVFIRRVVTDEELLAAAREKGIVVGATVNLTYYNGAVIQFVGVCHNEKEADERSPLIYEKWEMIKRPFVYIQYNPCLSCPIDNITEVVPQPEIKFPCLARSRLDNAVVLFVGLQEGTTVIKGNLLTSWEVGQKQQSWVDVDNKSVWEILPDNHVLSLSVADLNKILAAK